MNKVQVFLVAPVAFALLPAGHAALNDTGASLCSNGSTLIACDVLVAGDDGPYPRQDGRFGRDAQASGATLVKFGGGAAGFDFTRICRSGQTEGTGSCPAEPVVGAGNDDWGCTRDNVNGLVWEVKTSANESDTLTWSDAADAAASLDLCGRSDWRLPTRRELYSIANLGRVSPALDTTYFPNHNSQTGTVWAQDAFSGSFDGRWGVSFLGGASFPSQAGPVVETLLRFRAVSGAGIATADYQNAGDTVTDDATGLMWDRCPWGTVWDGGGSTCVGTPGAIVGWDAALDVSVQANQAEYLGHDDWRVPSARELETLVNLGASSGPVIDTTFFPQTPEDLFWSSTPYAAVPSSSWMIDFADGRIRLSETSVNTAHVRLVRGGQDADYLAAAENGACGSAAGEASLLAPQAAGLCTAGDASAVTSTNGEHAWTCDGIGSGVAAQCTAPGADAALVGGQAGSVTLAQTAGACTVDSAALVAPPVGGPPAVAMHYGAFEFVLSDCAGGATLEASFSGSVEGLGYWKYIDDAWVAMPATLSGNTATFTIADNGAFDADDTVGTIRDPSGPGAPLASAVPAIPGLTAWWMMLLAAGMGLLGMRAYGVVARRG